MADFTKPTVADMVVGNADINVGTNGSMQVVDWGPEDDAHWLENHARQPWAVADRSYDFYRPAYKYGHQASVSSARRPWDDNVEAELERGWRDASGGSDAEWSQVRDAVRAAYERSALIAIQRSLTAAA